MHVVKVADVVNSELKKAVCDSFVIVAIHSEIGEWEVEDWFCQVLKVVVEVKRLNHILIWAKPTSSAEFQRLTLDPPNFSGSPLRRLDRWTEVLGLSLKSCWVRMEGIPLHAWSEDAFRCLGGCLGQVVEIDESALLK